MVDVGQGQAVVIVPGIPGRCEWLQPAIDALATRYRVLSVSVTDLPRRDASFDQWAMTIDRMLDAAGVADATIVGVSFGALVAIHYAASRPARVRTVVLASSPSPRWRIDPRTAFYLRWPRLVMPLLVVRSIGRLAPEIVSSLPDWSSRSRFAGLYAWRALRYPLSATALRRWVEGWLAADVEQACARVASPVTVITGEVTLDRVVPVAATLQILELIPHATHVTFGGTGHAGSVTRPEAFADIVDRAIVAAEAFPVGRRAS